jgi:hypothetical protein
VLQAERIIFGLRGRRVELFELKLAQGTRNHCAGRPVFQQLIFGALRLTLINGVG